MHFFNKNVYYSSMSFKLYVSTLLLILSVFLITPAKAFAAVLPVSKGGTGASAFTNGSIFFFNGTSFAENNSNLFWDNTNNRLGLGTNSPQGQLHLGGAGQAVTDNYGLLIDDKTAGTNNFNVWSGPPYTSFDPKVQTEWRVTSIGKNVFTSLDEGSIVGQTGYFLSQNSESDANALVGVSYVTTGGISSFGTNSYAYSIAPTGQTVPEVVGGFFQGINDGTGTVTEMGGAKVTSNLNREGGTVTNNYGFKIQNQYAGINNYSIWTSQESGDNNYALYNEGEAKSFFGGKVGIKTQNPDASLDVVGPIKGDSTIILGNSTTPACIEAADSDGSGVSYITVNDGVLSASTTKPSFCQ